LHTESNAHRFGRLGNAGARRFFESLLVLLLAAVVLLQISRRLTVPSPAMLAATGVLAAGQA
jgi:monovalent cation/hydrogen antiporter